MTEVPIDKTPFDPTAANRVLTEILSERIRQHGIGYDAQHDALHGIGHLIEETHYRLGHMGEVASPASVREEALQAAAILVAAIELIDAENPELVLQDPPVHSSAAQEPVEFEPGEDADFMGTIMATCPDCDIPRPLNHDGPHMVGPEEVVVPEDPTEGQPDA